MEIRLLTLFGDDFRPNSEKMIMNQTVSISIIQFQEFRKAIL
ncbi:hypothetical protein [Methanobrevibacter sp.]|nr:hypothetical protein [Methanobrevibacter sp.]